MKIESLQMAFAGLFMRISANATSFEPFGLNSGLTLIAELNIENSCIRHVFYASESSIHGQPEVSALVI
jgi:hypothetical protein